MLRSLNSGGMIPLPLYEAPNEQAAAATPPPAKIELPPSKHDEALPSAQQTFPREYVEELRNENKTWRGKTVSERTAREAAEAKIAAAEAAAKAAKDAADAEATGKITEAEKRANERIIRAELKVAAQKAGMVDLDGLKLADLSSVKLKDDGTVDGADELMAKLKEAKPYLFGAAPTGSSNTTPPPKPDPGTPKRAKDMTPEEQQAFLADLRRKHP